MDKLLIVIPAYNEAENIREVLDAWYPIVADSNMEEGSQLVVINDGSKDNTLDILYEYAENRPMLKVIDKPNGGHGSSVLCGYKYALDNGADYVFQTDSDGQTNPEEFESFWNDRKKYSAIFGNRTHRGDGLSRAIVEKVLCRVLKHYFHVSMPDANAPFRLMTNSFLTRYLPYIPEDYNLPNAVLTAISVYYHESVSFKEISFKPRQGGVNSINIKRIFAIGKQAIKDFKDISAKL